MDGTLIDSEVMYVKILKHMCKSYGKTYNKELEKRLLGATDRVICETLTSELKLPVSPDHLETQLIEECRLSLPKAPLKQGAERLLQHLHASGVPMALATNSSAAAVRLQQARRPWLFKLFHHKVSVTDPEVFRGKPHPDLFLVAASRFPGKPKPRNCLVFEDSEVGVQAAKDAGMQVVYVTNHALHRSDRNKATLVIPSLLNFQPELFGLPPFKRPSNDPETFKFVAAKSYLSGLLQ